MKRRAADPLFLELRDRVAAAGYFRPAPWGYAGKTAVLVAVFAGAYAGLLVARGIVAAGVLLLVLAQMTAQLGYIAHDAGHGAITRNRRLARFIGQFGMTFITGFGFSWWMHSHNNHHASLNERDEDLAMKYSTVLAVHERAARSRRGLGRLFLRWQAYYIWFLLPFYHFAMMVDGLAWMARNPKTTRADQLGFALYLALYFAVPTAFIGPRLAAIHWLVTSMIGSIYIALTFIVHHVGKKVFSPGEEFTLFRQQLEATRTLKTWRVFDFYYSGLNYHIEHHFFHQVPHWRYRAMRLEVKAFCREHGLPYQEEGFWEAIANVFRHLDRMARIADEETAPGGSASSFEHDWS
jgi:fatty acid desaturase